MLHSFQGFGALERGCHFGLGIEALPVDALEHGRCCGLDMGASVLTRYSGALGHGCYSIFPFSLCYPHIAPI